METTQKLRKNEQIEVEDGYLEAEVKKGFVGLEWSSMDGVVKEGIGIKYGDPNVPSKYPTSYVLEGNRNPQPDGDRSTLVKREPTNLLRYRSMFTGIHPEIDRMLQVYDKLLEKGKL